MLSFYILEHYFVEHFPIGLNAFNHRLLCLKNMVLLSALAYLLLHLIRQFNHGQVSLSNNGLIGLLVDSKIGIENNVVKFRLSVFNDCFGLEVQARIQSELFC